MWARVAFCACFLWALCTSAPLLAQDKKETPKDDPVVELPWVVTEVGQNTCAMTAFVAAVPPPGQWQPWGVITTRILASDETKPLPRWQFVFTEALPLPRNLLDATVDGKPLPKILYEDFKKLQGFYPLLCRAVERTRDANQEMFVNSAEKHKHVVYTHLKATPGRYRGEVITVNGHLIVLRKEETPRMVAPEIRKEMPFVYTGLIVGPTKGTPPYTVLFTELPPEIPKETEKIDLEVTFYGYFLAFIDYPADKERGQKKDVLSPYLVGKTVVVTPPEKVAKLPTDKPDNSGTPYSMTLIAYTVGAIVVVAFLVVILNIWMRRGDRKIQSQLADVRDRHHPFNVEPAEEGAPPPMEQEAMPPLASPIEPPPTTTQQPSGDPDFRSN